MLRKYFSLTLGAGLLMLSAVIASAQTGELRGHVKLKQADGTSAPVAGAQIDVFRTDVNGKYDTKTDKRGFFVFAGLPYVGNYIIAVSASGAQPNFLKDVKVGRDVDYEVVLETGDGKRLTLAEINTILKGGSTGTAKTGATTMPSGESSADKAKRAEMEAKNKEITEHNKKVEESNALVSRTFKSGNEALLAGSELTKQNKRDEAITKYTEAITLYDEGIAADPDQPALLTNKAMALKSRGVDRYNTGITSKDPNEKGPKLEAAKADFKAAAEATRKALDLLKAESTADPANAARVNANRLSALAANAEAMRLYVTKADGTQADAGRAAYDEYIAAETDPAKKTKALRDEAQMLFDAAGQNADAAMYEKARDAYAKILEQNPDDLDVLLNLGYTYYNLGFFKEGQGNKEAAKPIYQEAANYFGKYVEKAPDGQLKSEVQGTLTELKNAQNVQAEKISTPTRRRKP